MRSSRLFFGSATFLASFLLFLIEPIAAKQLLPAFGGSAAVWITCLVFFQTALLVGYAYAHWSAQRVSWRWSAPLYLNMLLLGVATLGWSPGLNRLAQGTGHPISMIFAALALSVGLPFVLLGSTSPLLQVWLSRLQHGHVPYDLFALSNLGSLVALSIYPTLVEPNFTLHAQRIAWAGGFLLFVALASFLALKTQRDADGSPGTEETVALGGPAAPLRSKLLWLLLPMVAAMQLSAVTVHLTANVAAIPLLWILPLAAYLITLIIAFQWFRFVPRAILMRLLVVMLASLGYMLSKTDVSLPTGVALVFFLIELFLACLFCHGEAYVLRPQRASELTSFYIHFAAGGAIGSFLVGIAFPLLFSANYDLALSFLATAAMALVVTWEQNWSQRMLWSVGTVLSLWLVWVLHVVYYQQTLVSTRNFYGSLRVKQTESLPGVPLRTLVNGTIQHGTQLLTPALVRTPTSYYAEDSGAGLALRHCCNGRPRKIGVIGLGVGTLAAYGQKGDRLRFYEINPSVQPIAQHLFTYLRDSRAQISIADGDARSSLANEQPQQFDVLIVDAFSGDAIPLHLLTREAIEVYQRHLAPGGILAFHVSNQHVDLEPQIGLLAGAAGMQARTVQSLPDSRRGEFNATWVLLTKNAAFFSLPEVAHSARATEQRPDVRLWTDDYSSLLPVIRWR